MCHYAVLRMLVFSDAEGAMDLYEKAEQIDPNNADIYMNRWRVSFWVYTQLAPKQIGTLNRMRCWKT